MLLCVVKDYSFALDLLDDYDHQRVSLHDTTPGPVNALTYGEARRVVDRLRGKFEISGLFGQEKDDSLKGALGAVMQTFDGKEVYPSIEEEGANLLYFLIKDHPFIDGNKRIGAVFSVVPGKEQCPLPRRRNKAHCRQRSCRNDPSHCRKSAPGKRPPRPSSGESYQPEGAMKSEEPIMKRKNNLIASGKMAFLGI